MRRGILRVPMSAERSGWWAGLVAGFLTATAIYSGWFTNRIPVVALALWDRQMRLIPMQLFSFLIVRLKFAAKPAAFWGMLAVFVLLLGVVGAVVARWAGRRTGRLVAGAWLVVTGVLADDSGGGDPPGSRVPGGHHRARVRGRRRRRAVAGVLVAERHGGGAESVRPHRRASP